jgi:hypothetical protein
MTTMARLAGVGLLLIATGLDDAVVAGADAPRAFLGACYCRVGETLRCTSDLTERDCRQRCDEALCDDWFWKERLPCWNWGYGG